MADDHFSGCNQSEAMVLDAADHALIPLQYVIAMPSGLASVPCETFGLSRVGTPSGAVHVVVQLARHQLMLHEAFTPEGARIFAQTVLRMADAAEAAMLEASNAQLAAALAKGKRA